jgi:hypothetical protein
MSSPEQLPSLKQMGSGVPKNADFRAFICSRIITLLETHPILAEFATDVAQLCGEFVIRQKIRGV